MLVATTFVKCLFFSWLHRLFKTILVASFVSIFLVASFVSNVSRSVANSVLETTEDLGLSQT